MRWAPVVALVCVLLICAAFACGALSGNKRRQRLERATLDSKLDIITRSLDQDGPSGKLQHPFVVVRAQDFLIAGRLISFEESRRAGHHIVLDTVDQLKSFERKERIIFFSHQVRARSHSSELLHQPPSPPLTPSRPSLCLCQWTSYTAPDPSTMQYQAMVAALQRVQAAKRWPLERTFVWVE